MAPSDSEEELNTEQMIKEQKKNVFDNILEEKEMMLKRLMTILIKLLAFK